MCCWLGTILLRPQTYNKQELPLNSYLGHLFTRMVSCKVNIDLLTTLLFTKKKLQP